MSTKTLLEVERPELKGIEEPTYLGVTVGRTTYPAKEYDITSYWPYVCFPYMLFGLPYDSKLHADPGNATYMRCLLYDKMYFY